MKVQDEVLGPPFLRAGMRHVEISGALDGAFGFQGCRALGGSRLDPSLDEAGYLSSRRWTESCLILEVHEKDQLGDWKVLSPFNLQID